MKKHLLAAAVAAAVSVPAMAQNVSLYGALDASVQNINNVTANTSISMGYVDSAIVSSVWGVRGSEDLGGGLKASFELQSDVATNNGGMNAAGLFRRAAWVGISSNEFGEISFGLRLNPLIAANGALMPVSGNSVATTTATVMGYADFFTRNAVTYTSPTISGFQAQAQYGMSNNAADATGGSVTAWRLTYANGPFSVQLAGQDRKSILCGNGTMAAPNNTNDRSNCGGSISSANPTTPAQTLGGAAINEQLYNAAFGLLATGTTNVNSRDALGKSTLIAGVRYKLTPALDLGLARIQNTVNNTDADVTSTGTGGLATAAGATKVTATQIGIGYQYSPAVLLGASLTSAESSRLTNLQARYALSKRTTAYAQYGMANNDANGTVKFFPTATNTGVAPAPVLNGGTAVGVAATQQSSIGFGVIHTF